MPTTPFTWVPIYKEIARKVLEYQQNQKALIDLIREMGNANLRVISLADEGVDDEEYELREIDPFTFFACFNRGTRKESRLAVIEYIKKHWELKENLPFDFDGIPLVISQSAWFFRYAKKRTPEDIPKLWRLAKEAITESPSSFDRKLFDGCLAINGIGLSKLTIGMFWLRPDMFIATDGNNVSYFRSRGITIQSETANGYFHYLSEVEEKFGHDFPNLSYRAYLEAKKQKPTVADIESSDEIQFWTLGTGSGGERWQEFYSQNIIAIDFGIKDDLKKYANRDLIRSEINKLKGDNLPHYNDTLACWEFVHTIKPGDIIFAKQGVGKMFGCGRIVSDYLYDGSRTNFKHLRKVEWLAIGDWDIQKAGISAKTLTEITPYKEAVDLLLQIGGIDPATLEITEETMEAAIAIATEPKYYWLNANPKIWDFEKVTIGETQVYTSHNDKGNQRQKYKYFAEVKPGDLLIGYVTSPQREIVAICQITKGLHQTPYGEGIEFKKIETFRNTIGYD